MEERGAMGEIKSLVLVISGGRCEVERRGCVKKEKKKKRSQNVPSCSGKVCEKTAENVGCVAATGFFVKNQYDIQN